VYTHTHTHTHTHIRRRQERERERERSGLHREDRDDMCSVAMVAMATFRVPKTPISQNANRPHHANRLSKYHYMSQTRHRLTEDAQQEQIPRHGVESKSAPDMPPTAERRAHSRGRGEPRQGGKAPPGGALPGATRLEAPRRALRPPRSRRKPTRPRSPVEAGGVRGPARTPGRLGGGPARGLRRSAGLGPPSEGGSPTARAARGKCRNETNHSLSGKRMNHP